MNSTTLPLNFIARSFPRPTFPSAIFKAGGGIEGLWDPVFGCTRMYHTEKVVYADKSDLLVSGDVLADLLADFLVDYC